MPRVLSVHVGVAVDAKLIAVFSSEQLVYGNTIEFSDDIPKRNFNARNTASLTAVSAELLDSVEYFFDIQRIFTEKSSLEHERICCARRVSYLAKANNARIRVYLQKYHVLRQAVDICNPYVGYLEFTLIHFLSPILFSAPLLSRITQKSPDAMI